MLTPVQSGQSLAVTNVMQSIVDGIDERRREDAEKQSGRKDDAIQQAMVRSDEAARQANTRINEHFFGKGARNDDTVATLIARLSSSLGVTQQKDESSRAFAQRLTDAVAFMDGVAKFLYLDVQSEVTLNVLGTNVENVKAAMAGEIVDDDAAQLVARAASNFGVVQGDGESDEDFANRLDAFLTTWRSDLPQNSETLERQLGLDKLGVSIGELIAAIANPAGPEAQKIDAALTAKAESEKAITPEMQKTLQRLEDTADTKTIEELKLDKTRNDPTRIEDSETRQERDETIRALEAGEKLEDVKDLQDAVATANDKVADGEKPGKPSEAQDSVGRALSIIQVLAAGAAAIAPAAETTTPARDASSEPEGTSAAAADGEDSVERALSAEPDDEIEDAREEIFTLRVDENGIYDLITRQIAAY